MFYYTVSSSKLGKDMIYRITTEIETVRETNKINITITNNFVQSPYNQILCNYCGILHSTIEIKFSNKTTVISHHDTDSKIVKFEITTDNNSSDLLETIRKISLFLGISFEEYYHVFKKGIRWYNNQFSRWINEITGCYELF